jgi:hypothetical protein
MMTEYVMTILARAALAAGLSLSAISAHAAPMALALVDGGRALARIADLNRPAMGAPMAIRDAAGQAVTLDALAWRPATRGLYGFSAATDTVYAVDPTTAVATASATLAGAVGAASVAFDFNNQIDAARLVSAAGDNLVYFPRNEPADIKRFTPLFYVEGDVNAGRSPRVFGNAYTNAVPAAGSTVQYVLDAATNSMATLANNTGELRTVGGLTLDGVALAVSDVGDFDIVSAREGDNRAFAVLTTAVGTGLYAVALARDASGGVPVRLIAPLPGPVVGLAVMEQAPGEPRS